MIQYRALTYSKLLPYYFNKTTKKAELKKHITQPTKAESACYDFFSDFIIFL